MVAGKVGVHSMQQFVFIKLSHVVGRDKIPTETHASRA